MSAIPPDTTRRPPARTRRSGRAALVAAVCAALTATVAGCAAEDPDAGTNGVGKLPAQQIEAKARAAAAGTDTVRLSGKVVSQGATYTLDMRLAKNGARGELTTKATSFQLLRIDDALYLKADASFWVGEKSGSAATAAKLGNKYVKVPAADPVYQRFSGFTDKDTLLAGLLGLHGELTAGNRGTVGGVRTVQVAAGSGSGGTLDVSLEGTPYPLRFQRAGGAGELTLADWGKSVDLKTPDQSQVVDYGKRISQTGG